MESYLSDAENNLHFDRTKAIGELARGHELAVELQNLIDKSKQSNNIGSVVNHDLVSKILESFTNTISMLNNDDGDFSDEAVSQIVTDPHLSSPQDSYGETSRTPIRKDGRGCYKRRKCSETWTRMNTNLVDDGQAWRKYGQKKILGSKYPRSYFRCTHKFEKGCEATKQVQQIGEKPPMFKTTYYGHHTCQNYLSFPKVLMESDDAAPPDSSMISFDKVESNNQFLSSFSSTKQERPAIKAEIFPHGGDAYHPHHHRQYQSSWSEYSMQPELTTAAFGESSPTDTTTRGLDGYSSGFDEYLRLQF